jgi:hypothetical protein
MAIQCDILTVHTEVSSRISRPAIYAVAQIAAARHRSSTIFPLARAPRVGHGSEVRDEVLPSMYQSRAKARTNQRLDCGVFWPKRSALSVRFLHQ